MCDTDWGNFFRLGTRGSKRWLRRSMCIRVRPFLFRLLFSSDFHQASDQGNYDGDPIRGAATKDEWLRRCEAHNSTPSIGLIIPNGKWPDAGDDDSKHRSNLLEECLPESKPTTCKHFLPGDTLKNREV